MLSVTLPMNSLTHPLDDFDFLEEGGWREDLSPFGLPGQKGNPIGDG